MATGACKTGRLSKWEFGTSTNVASVYNLLLRNRQKIEKDFLLKKEDETPVFIYSNAYFFLYTIGGNKDHAGL